jgi:hypothetical protein
MTEKARPGVRASGRADARTGDADQKNYQELNWRYANRGVTVIGGANIRTQMPTLRRGAELYFRPRRLLDLTERGSQSSIVEVLCLTRLIACWTWDSRRNSPYT